MGKIFKLNSMSHTQNEYMKAVNGHVGKKGFNRIGEGRDRRMKVETMEIH